MNFPLTRSAMLRMSARPLPTGERCSGGPTRQRRARVSAAEGLDLDRRGEDRLLGRDKPEPLPVQRLEVAPHDARLRQRDRQRRVGAGVAQMQLRLDRDVVVLDTLVQELLGRRAAEVVGEALDGVHGGSIERHLERALAA